jgi:hypothetical protein
VKQCPAPAAPTATTGRDIAAEVIAEYGSPADAATYRAMHDNTALWNYPAAIATIPDGYTFERVGQCWSVGPSGSGTHVLVTDTMQIPAAIAAFDRHIARAAQIGATR